MFSFDDIKKALKANQLYIDIGGFRLKLSVEGRSLQHLMAQHLFEHYRPVLVRSPAERLVDHEINLGAPYWLRRFFRPQVAANPQFDFPIVPLPFRLAPLAFEMAANLSLALGCLRFLVIHAAVVSRMGQAILISADSGSGKSTLAASLMADGYRFFSDEFALLALDEAGLSAKDSDGGTCENKTEQIYQAGFLYPYPRPISLKNQSIDIVRQFWPSVSKVYQGSPKGAIAFASPRAEDMKAILPAKPKLILFPHFKKGASPQATALTKIETAMRLMHSAPNYSLLGAAAFEAIVNLVDQSPAYSLSYGTSAEALALIAKLEKGLPHHG